MRPQLSHSTTLPLFFSSSNLALGRAMKQPLHWPSISFAIGGVQPVADAHQEAVQDAVEELMLFTTKTCPNCKIAKSELEKAGLDYTVMDVSDHLDLVSQFGIQQAPTLIVRKDGQVEKLVGASPIKRFATGKAQ